MVALSAEFSAHLEGAVTTVCHCWRLTRTDGVVMGFTDHDLKFFCDGTEFRPDTGLAGTEARRSMGLAADAMDVEGILSSLDIDEPDIVAGIYDGAVVETLLVNWQDAGQFARLGRSIIGQITRQDGRFIAELESQERSLDQTNGRTLRRSCDAELGDERCGIDLETPLHKGHGVVELVRENSLLVSGLEVFRTGWFFNGVLTWVSGEGTGRQERVSGHRKEGGLVRLDLWRQGETLALAGNAFTIRLGCDKQFSTCKAKFGNSAHFRGFPHLPGDDAAYTYVSEGQVFDGGPLVE